MAAQETRFTEINNEKDCNRISKLPKKMTIDNNDVIGDKCVKDKDNNLVLGDKEKLRVWKTNYEQLLNVEFDWDDSSLSIEPFVEDPAIKMTKDMVAEAIMKMKELKACGLCHGIVPPTTMGGQFLQAMGALELSLAPGGLSQIGGLKSFEVFSIMTQLLHFYNPKLHF